MIFLLSASLANAEMIRIKPLNRLSVGTSYVDSSYGASFGFESRLTHIIYLNIGAFRSISDSIFEGDRPEDELNLRHGVWAAPGIRFPHRYNKGKNAVNWDLFLRAGFGCFFNDVADKPYAFNVEPGGLVGADFTLQWRSYGLKFSGKGIFQNAYASIQDQSITLLSPMGTVEVFSQF